MNNSNSNEITETTNVVTPSTEENVETTNTTEVENKTNETSTETPNEDKSTETTTEEKTTEVVEDEKKDGLKNLDEDFVYQVMSIPTVSDEEYRMVSFIILWARRNNIKYEFDDYGNVYLTKGELAEGEYYPCVTSHLDTVQHKAKSYAQAGCSLDIKTCIANGKHELYVDGMGIGADDKAGVLISLSLFSHVDKLKACFFLEEEVGCKGSEHMNVEWFNNVGYVIGWDSPELNRAAWACSGVKLFDRDFFDNHIKEVCARHGLTKFHSEPYTDVKLIRQKTNIICMNFGNGGWNAHMPTEYCVLEDMDVACGMGIDLIQSLGCKQYLLEHKEKSYAWVKGADGTYHKPEEDKDEVYFRTLDGVTRTYNTTSNMHHGYFDEDEYWDGYYRGHHTSSTTSSSFTTPSTTPQKKEEPKDMVKAETVKYITEKYEEHILNIKTEVKKKFDELGLDFDMIKEVFNNDIKF